jgi:vacuolar-type H+-ATPase subunit H
MVDSTSPLQAIKQKEAELRHRVEEARRRAESQLQSAREEAEQTVARANQKGQAEAKALYEQKIKEARREAKAIVATAHQEATTFRRQAAARLDEAVRQIVELVLPVGVSLSEDAGLSGSDSALE